MPTLIIDGTEIISNTALNYIIGTQTLVPENPAIDINGVSYSFAPSTTAFIYGNNIVTLASKKDETPILNVADVVITANSVFKYVVDKQTLIPIGHPITIKGAVYSLPSSATALISNGVAVPLISDSASLPPAIMIEGTSYRKNAASEFLIGSQTLIPEGDSITVDGAVYSLGPSATVLISNGIPIPILSDAAPIPTAISIGGIMYSRNSASEYLIGSQTLIFNGHSITIKGTSYSLSLGPSGEALIIDDSTSYLSTAQATQIPDVITIGFLLYTKNQASDYIIDGQTLSPGSEITVAGTIISLGPQGTNVVIGTKTEEIGLGTLTMNGWNGQPTSSAKTEDNVNGHTGNAMKRKTNEKVFWIITCATVINIIILN